VKSVQSVAKDSSPADPSDCFICRKHRGLEPAPPGGYIFEDENWKVCHAPANLGPLGTLFIESTRHFLDYSEMTPQESASLGHVLKNTYTALREHAQAERIYQLSTMEGQPHFHSWLVPRRKEDMERVLQFLAREDTCEEQDAVELTAKLRAAMVSGIS